MNTRDMSGTLATLPLLMFVLTAPASAASLAATDPAHPIPQPTFERPGPDPSSGAGEPPAPVVEFPVAGRAALVPTIVDGDATAPTRIAQADLNANTRDTDTAGGGSVDDLSFVQQATENGRRELASARDALPRLRNPDLKRIASMLVDDHRSANAALARIAQSKGWPMPAPDVAAARVPASATAGDDFDELWTTEMIAGHERSAALYRAQIQGGEDPELRRFARDTLPAIEHHLEELRRQQ